MKKKKFLFTSFVTYQKRNEGEKVTDAEMERRIPHIMSGNLPGWVRRRKNTRMYTILSID